VRRPCEENFLRSFGDAVHRVHKPGRDAKRNWGLVSGTGDLEVELWISKWNWRFGSGIGGLGSGTGGL
jgi:hypothetical protein